jgi:hypothetical protein
MNFIKINYNGDIQFERYFDNIYGNPFNLGSACYEFVDMQNSGCYSVDSFSNKLVDIRGVACNANTASLSSTTISVLNYDANTIKKYLSFPNLTQWIISNPISYKHFNHGGTLRIPTFIFVTRRSNQSNGAHYFFECETATAVQNFWFKGAHDDGKYNIRMNSVQHEIPGYSYTTDEWFVVSMTIDPTYSATQSTIKVRQNGVELGYVIATKSANDWIWSNQSTYNMTWLSNPSATVEITADWASFCLVDVNGDPSAILKIERYLMNLVNSVKSVSMTP